MEVFNIGENRSEYFQTQIIRSRKKFAYCKVSFHHVKKWKSILEKNAPYSGPFLCLGTRNGREIDLFRNVLYSGLFLNLGIRLFEIRRNGYSSILSSIESYNRSSVAKIGQNSIVGVEINPDASRQDVLTASFDDLPENWQNSFGVIYSNAFDQSQDPFKTAQEWIRIAKDGAIFILGFSYNEPNQTDPVGKLTVKDFIELFPGELLYFEKFGSRYHDVMIQINKK